MPDGHTESGGWPVTLELDADQVEMLIRSIEAAALMSGSDKIGGQPQNTMQMIAYREFLKEIVTNLKAALEQQRP